MIQWPHIGLYGDFSECEEGILEMMNQNFFLLDILTQGSVLGIVTELPSDPEEGDSYILDTGGPYGGEAHDIMVWDGERWVEIDPKPGFVMFNNDDSQFYWFNGSTWVLFPTTIGDVSGPASSLDNSVARFDGVTGKWIQDSGVTIDDSDVIRGVQGIYAEFSANKFLDGLFTADSSSSGPDVSLGALPSQVVKFTGALVSIDSIAAPSQPGYSRLHVLMNETGDVMTIKNSASIRTGTGLNLAVPNGGAVWISYDPDSSQWVVVGGSGGGGGGGIAASNIKSISSANSPYTVPDDAKIVLVDASGGSVDIILPTADSSHVGFDVMIKRLDDVEANAVTVEVDDPGAETIDVDKTEETVPFKDDMYRFICHAESEWGTYS